jgi:hypothetical protein
VARLTRQHPAPPAPERAVPAVGRPSPTGIIELIMADHRRIRRLSQALQDAARRGDPGWILADAWRQLADLLNVHTRAEEEICYLPMFGSGPDGIARMRDAIDCHDDIREAIGEAAPHAVGSPSWWRAVRAAQAAVNDHLEREEHDIRAGQLPRLAAGARRELGRQWTAFTAAWRQDSRREGLDVAPAADGRLPRGS